MPYLLPGGRKVAATSSFELDGNTYSRGWLKTSTVAERTALGITWVDPEPKPPAPPPTTDQVTVYAEQLIEAGVTINVSGNTEPVYVQGRDKDTRNVQGLVTAATLRISSGDTTTLTAFRDGNNVTHQLVPAQVVEMWQLSAAYVSAVYAASWAIKAEDPIAADFRSDLRWPNPDKSV